MTIIGEMKQDSSRNLPRVEIDSNATLNITKEFNSLVRYLCSEIKHVEWSGILFYNVEGDLNSPEGLVITPIDIYPMHKGDSAYTEYDFTDDVMDYFDAHPERFGMKWGHIHSHNNMSVFFSGTDMQELVDNCVNHAYYVSVIVNNKNEIVGKIAIAGKRQVRSDSTYLFSGILGTLIKIPKSVNKEETVMYTVDMNVEREAENKLFYDRVIKLNAPSGPIPTQGKVWGSPDFGRREPWDDRPNEPYQRNIQFNEYSKEHKAAPTVLPNELELKDRYPIIDIFVDLCGGGSKDYKGVLLELVGSDATKADIKEFVESSFSLESVTEEMQNYEREFLSRPDAEDVVWVFNKLRDIARTMLTVQDVAWVCIVIIETINLELSKIQDYEG